MPNFSIANAAAGTGHGLGIMLLLSLLYRGGMGCGDVKMGGLVGAMVGFPGILTAMFIAVVVGGLVSGVLVALAVKRPKETIAFGPFLSLLRYDDGPCLGKLSCNLVYGLFMKGPRKNRSWVLGTQGSVPKTCFRLSLLQNTVCSQSTSSPVSHVSYSSFLVVLHLVVLQHLS